MAVVQMRCEQYERGIIVTDPKEAKRFVAWLMRKGWWFRAQRNSSDEWMFVFSGSIQDKELPPVKFVPFAQAAI